jgi:non-heme chloroperoxidase
MLPCGGFLQEGVVRRWFAIFILIPSLCSLLAAATQAKTGFITTSDGVKIHYLEAGNGEPILFIPGWTMTAEIWQPQLDVLSAKYRVIAVDPRSQGDSDKPADGNYPERRARDYKELVDALKLRRPVLVGWSLAVGEVLSYVDQFGADGLRGVVLVDGFVKLDPATVAEFPPHFRRVSTDRKAFTEEFVRSMYKKPHGDDYLAKIVTASLKTPTNSALALLMAALATPDMSDTLSKMESTPLLFEYQPEEQSQADVVKAKLPKATLHRYGDDGHALFVDDAKRFNRVLDEFMVATQ